MVKWPETLKQLAWLKKDIFKKGFSILTASYTIEIEN